MHGPSSRNSRGILNFCCEQDFQIITAGQDEVAAPVRQYTAVDDDDEDNKLPVDLPGASVEQQSLGDQYPLFPYDPEQDKPAAEAF